MEGEEGLCTLALLIGGEKDQEVEEEEDLPEDGGECVRVCVFVFLFLWKEGGEEEKEVRRKLLSIFQTAGERSMGEWAREATICSEARSWRVTMPTSWPLRLMTCVCVCVCVHAYVCQ